MHVLVQLNFRVGRTARMQNKGEALLVLTPSQEQPFIKMLTERHVPISQVEYAFVLFVWRSCYFYFAE